MSAWPPSVSPPPCYKPMSAEIVFSGGQRVVVPSVDANAVMEMLVVQGPPEQVRSGGTVRSGFVPFESDHGIVYVRPDQVADGQCGRAAGDRPANGSIRDAAWSVIAWTTLVLRRTLLWRSFTPPLAKPFERPGDTGTQAFHPVEYLTVI